MSMHRQDSIFEICAVLSENENLKVTLQEASKGALLVGLFAFVGGLLGGPVGLAIGKFITYCNCYILIVFNIF